MDTDEPFKMLQKALKELRTYGINGVPTFIIEGRLIFGAQPYEFFNQIINQILDEKSREK